MNQEAIDQIKADRDSALDLMGKAMDERDHFLKQRDEYQVAADELAAENKVLRDALNDIVEGSSDKSAVDCAFEALTKEATK